MGSGRCLGGERVVALVLAIAALAVLALAGAADAAVYKGRGHPQNVEITLRTNPHGTPYNLRYGNYDISCTNGYRWRNRIVGAVPPFDLATRNRLVDHWVNRTHRKTRRIVIDLQARRHGNRWYGRFRARWAFREDGEVYTRCGVHWRFRLALVR